MLHRKLSREKRRMRDRSVNALGTSEQITAVHEAGHAIVGHVLGFPVTLITIIPDEESRGHCNYHNGDRHGEYHQEEAIVYLAGSAAAHRFYGRAAAIRGRRLDYQRASTLTGCGIQPQLIDGLWLPQRPTQRFMQALRVAEHLVSEHRSAITILARWLLVEKHMHDPLAIERLLSHLTVESASSSS